MSYAIFADTSADLPRSCLLERGISLIPLPVSTAELRFDGLPDGDGAALARFYAALRAGAQFKSSSANHSELAARWEPLLREGRDILYIGFPSIMSSNLESARFFARELLASYPGRDIRILDGCSVSMGLGILALLAAEQRDAGASLADCCSYLETIKQHVANYFFVDDLAHLRRSGRLDALGAAAGAVLSIKPVFCIGRDGRVLPLGKAKGRKGAMGRIVELLRANFDPALTREIWVGHADSPEDLKRLCAMVEEAAPGVPIRTFCVGPTLACHVGPGTGGFFFVGKERER